MSESDFKIDQVSLVARLRLTDEEKKKFEKEMRDILDSFSEINEAEGLDKETEMHYPSRQEHEFRKDEVKECEYFDRFVELFTKKDGRHMVAPKSRV